MNADANEDQAKRNLSIWNLACKTDPAATKNYRGAGGFSGTSISSLYPVQRATEIFGPIGEGWGFEIVSDEFIQGGPMINKEGVSLNCNEQTHSMRIAMWARQNGKTLQSIGIGLTPHITQNKYGVVTDHEAQKKSLTDAIKGALKLWGFSADVYMGMHDDAEYVNYVTNQSAMEKTDQQEAEAIKQKQEYDEWKEKALKQIETATTVYELESLYKPAARKTSLHADKDFSMRLKKATNQRKSELELIKDKEPS